MALHQSEDTGAATAAFAGHRPRLIAVSAPEPCDHGECDILELQSSSVTTLASGSFYFDQNELYPLRFHMSAGLIPATLFILPKDLSDFTLADLESTIHRFEKTDDVWDRQFLACVVFLQPWSYRARHALPPLLADRLHSLGTKRVALIDESFLSLKQVTEGPYFVTTTGILPVRKLVPDTYGAFVASLVQSPSQEIRYLNATIAEAYPRQAIALPSRLYYPPSKEKPLNGLRTAIKDNIDIAGAKTFASCLAHGEFYGVQLRNAPAVQRLLDLGAVIIGKTGMSQFADAEDPTGDFVDFHAPWNPRGDGNRSPGGSSFGSGAAAGGYDWVDFTIGTDTGGSVRQPAASQSVYGLRPSRGAMSVNGTLIIHQDLDAIGVLSRHLDIVKVVSEHLFKDTVSVFKTQLASAAETPQLIYPSHLFPVKEKIVQDLYEKVVRALEKVLGVERRIIDFNKEWNRLRNNTDQSMEAYFQEVFYDYVVWGQFHHRTAFRDEYLETLRRPPYVNPLARFRWKLGSEMSEEHWVTIQSKRQEYQKFIEGIFGDNSIMVTPFKFGEPDARDVYRPEPTTREKGEFGYGLRPAFQSPMAGQPEIVFPVGQLPYYSSVSLQDEMYGVIASLIGSRGMESVILEIVDKVLRELDLPRTVLTGRSPFAASTPTQ